MFANITKGGGQCYNRVLLYGQLRDTSFPCIGDDAMAYYCKLITCRTEEKVEDFGETHGGWMGAAHVAGVGLRLCNIQPKRSLNVKPKLGTQLGRCLHSKFFDCLDLIVLSDLWALVYLGIL